MLACQIKFFIALNRRAIWSPSHSSPAAWPFPFQRFDSSQALYFYGKLFAPLFPSRCPLAGDPWGSVLSHPVPQPCVPGGEEQPGLSALAGLGGWGHPSPFQGTGSPRPNPSFSSFFLAFCEPHGLLSGCSALLRPRG